MKPLNHFVAALLLTSALGPALALPPATGGSHDSHHAAAAASAAPSDQSDLSEGEITRWDPRTRKVTLRHGELKNLEMPPMTMVFRVNDASLLAPLRPGDKVRFRAERQDGGYVITRMEAAR